MFRIIHISDLHFQSGMHQKRVIAALCEDIKRARAEQEINAIVFSGDAAAKGQTQEVEVEQILAHFVSHLRESAGQEVPLILCPGNHDINLKMRADMFLPMFEAITSPDKANELVRQAHSDAAKPVWGHIDGFRSLASAIDKDAFAQHPLFYTKRLTGGGISVGFACVNSAWMTRGGGNADYGKLYVGEYILDLARRELKDSDIRIAVMHHPLDWLAPEEKSAIQRYLTLNFHGYLCGHKHDNNAETLNSNLGTLFTSNTGCVYQSNEYFNGYSLVDIDSSEKKWVLNAREYYFQRDVFDVATRFAMGGRWETPFATSHSSIQVSISGEVVRAINERANSLLLSYVASDVAPKSIGALFVEPPLSVMSEKELIAKSKDDSVQQSSYQSLASLGQLSESIFFIGKREAGKSLLLHHIAVNCFQSFRGDARIGVVVDMGALNKFTEAAVLEQAVEFCGGEIPRRDIVKLLSAGQVVVCLDNVKTLDQKGVDLVRDFIKKYPTVRYLFAASEELLNDLSGNEIPELGVPIVRMFVHSFRDRHTKELVKRWFGSGDLTLTKRVQNVTQLLNRLRVPRTPFLVSVLSWVLEQRPNSNVVNRASAIEVLIEGLLEKFRESKTRKDLDSTIKQHFLAEFAMHLNECDMEWMGRLDFDQFVVSYFKKRGLTVSTDGFAVELIRKGLLFATDERVGFKFDCFRAYFLAKKFAEIPALWQSAFQPGSVGRYATELDLFTGLHRDRAEVLRMAKELCTKTFSDLNIEFPLDEIDRIDKAALLIGSEIIDDVETTFLNNEAPSGESHLETPDAVSADHEESRKRRVLPEMGEVGNFLESLRVFSMVLRNSELVDDIDLKRESFNLALEQWANTTIAVILSSQANEFRAASVDNKSAQPVQKIQDYSLARAMVPQMIISIMCDALSTPKLELFARERKSDKRTLVRVLAVFLSFNAGDSESVVMAKSLLKDYKNNGFIVEMLFFRLLGLYIGLGKEGADSELRELIGDVVIQLRGGTAKDASLIKSRFLGALDKKLLIKEFKEKPPHRN